MQRSPQLLRLCSSLLFALAFAMLCLAGLAVAQDLQTSAPIQLTFPLKADVPNQDQYLTSSTAPVNSTFDHSMLDSTTHYPGSTLQERLNPHSADTKTRPPGSGLYSSISRTRGGGPPLLRANCTRRRGRLCKKDRKSAIVEVAGGNI